MWRDNRTTSAIGAMRLSTEPSRDAARAIAALHAAFDAGVTLVDTADAYALDEGDVGHNERLIAQAIAAWPGDRQRIGVVTKGGLTRPAGRWQPDGRARHLRYAAALSRKSLAVSRIALYQLHAPDPRVPLATSVRALAALVRDGVVESIGLSNVTVQQIEAAQAIVPVTAVQVELSPWKDRAVASGVVEHCLAHDITLLAYRPFGGVAGARRVIADALLREIAEAHAVSAFTVVLAWIRGLAPQVVPLPGPTTVDTARACGQRVQLESAAQEALDRHFPSGRWRTRATIAPLRSPAADAEDVVLIMGLPGAGKTTLAMEFVAKGYERLNRDEAGGSLAALIPPLEELLEQGVGRIVLDNTYLSRASRRAVIDAVSRHGRAVRGVWIDAALEDAQVHVVRRMVQVHGRLLSSGELKDGRTPDRLSPSALFRAQREVEAPAGNEGFASLEIRPHEPYVDPQSNNRAVVVWCDDILRPGAGARARGQQSVDDRILAQRAARLASHHAAGWRVIGLAWEPEIGEGRVSVADVEAQHAALTARLGFDMPIHYCPHGAGPPVCWCRKPLPGLGVWVAYLYQLDVPRCIFVGRSGQDESFARRVGFGYQDADRFFAETGAL